jgi:PPPDE putative peptidase domain
MSSVKLYVYDLSNGLARQLSLQMTGKQIDGVWHTSVVIFGKEVFYGQGISITAPGKSHVCPIFVKRVVILSGCMLAWLTHADYRYGRDCHRRRDFPAIFSGDQGALYGR